MSGGLVRVNAWDYGDGAWMGLWSVQTRWAEWPPAALQDSMIRLLSCCELFLHEVFFTVVGFDEFSGYFLIDRFKQTGE